MADDESETELNMDNSNNLGKRVRRDIDSSSGRSEKRKSAKGKDKEKQRVNTDADGDEGKPHSKKPSAGINKRKRRGRDPVEKGIARERRAINLFKTTSEKLTLRQALVKAHQRYGHVAPSRLVGFKSKGKIYSSLIPSSGRLSHLPCNEGEETAQTTILTEGRAQEARPVGEGWGGFFGQVQGCIISR